MFGKGQGVLGAWLKEFCQLVFVQTIQAFIYAIIISFVVQIILSTNATNMDATDYRTGLGLMCVFAMVSVFKIEDLLRKILGFGTTKADHGSAVKSIAKTAFAMQLGKRVLDNGKKMVGGFSRYRQANKNIRNARRQLKEDKEALNSDMSSGNAPTLNGEARPSISTSAVLDGSSATTNTTSSSNNYAQRLRALQRENETRLGEIRKQRNAAIKDMASGVLETGGAVYGATMGAIIGGADGNFDEAIQGVLAGAGLGDSAGKAVVNVGAAGINTVTGGWGMIKDAGKTGSAIVSNYKTNRDNGVRHAMREAIRQESGSVGNYKRDLRRLKKEIKEIDKKVDNAND